MGQVDGKFVFATISLIRRAVLERIVELISDAPDGEDVFRLFRIFFNFRAQTIYVRIDVAFVTFICRIPDCRQQILSREIDYACQRLP